MVFIISLLAEVVQCVLGLGPGDIDNIILNCLGGLIGVLPGKLTELAVKPDKPSNAGY
ncbi:MAG: VanZ family protein [Syntrophomonas sp.]